jgi:hypothetical protein
MTGGGALRSGNIRKSSTPAPKKIQQKRPGDELFIFVLLSLSLSLSLA